MANNPSAIKRIRQNEKRRARNRSHKGHLRTAVKDVREAIDAGNLESAEKSLAATLPLVDSSVGKGIIHRNTAARTKSRLTRAVEQVRANAS